MITPRPGLDPNNLNKLKPGAAMKPFYGVDIALMDPETKVSYHVDLYRVFGNVISSNLVKS